MKTEGSGDSFAALFERQEKPTPKARSIRIGERLEGTVVQVGKEAIFLELDGKRQAYMDLAEVRTTDGTVTVKVGDRVTAQVVEMDARTGNVRVGRSSGKPGSLAALEQARDAGLPIEAKVTGINKGGLEIELDGAKAFCPLSQSDTRTPEDAKELIGKVFRFLVTELRDNGRSVVLSRKALRERESREAAQKLLRELAVGTTVRGTVTGVREFGAFVDLGGIEGLIPASEVSHARGTIVSDVLAPGDVVNVQVRELKENPAGKPGDQGVRITLSLKALSADPWEGVESSLVLGRVVQGTVTRLADFGAFVRVPAGVEGLLHISELGARVDHPSKVLKVGQAISVVLQKVDVAAKKLSLSRAPEGMGDGDTVAQVKVGLGAIVQGKVERIETFGVFLQLDGSSGRSGRGLIPNVELGLPRGADVRKHFPKARL